MLILVIAVLLPALPANNYSYYPSLESSGDALCMATFPIDSVLGK